jgi:hypothetical protein
MVIVKRSLTLALAAMAKKGAINMAKEHAEALRAARGRLVDSKTGIGDRFS